jgi:hypothetical protein
MLMKFFVNMKLNDGSSIIMTFNVDGVGHAVIVTGVKDGKVQYYDPSTNTAGTKANGDYSAMYGVTMNNSSSYSSGYYNSGGYTYYW